jgi:hypothetical protein
MVSIVDCGRPFSLPTWAQNLSTTSCRCFRTRCLQRISSLSHKYTTPFIPHVRALGALKDVSELELFDQLIIQLQISLRRLLCRNGRRDAPLFGLRFCHGDDWALLRRKDVDVLEVHSRGGAARGFVAPGEAASRDCVVKREVAHGVMLKY